MMLPPPRSTLFPYTTLFRSLVAGYGDYKNTADRPAEIPYTDGHWEGIPTTNDSYGWSRIDHGHKAPEHFIVLLAKRSEEHTSELQSPMYLVCRLLLEKKKLI